MDTYQTEIIGFDEESDFDPDDPRPWVVDTTDADWIEELVESACMGLNLVVLDGGRCVFINRMRATGKPVWAELWRLLDRAGVSAPRWPR
jgi:hypothetical protein